MVEHKLTLLGIGSWKVVPHVFRECDCILIYSFSSHYGKLSLAKHQETRFTLECGKTIGQVMSLCGFLKIYCKSYNQLKHFWSFHKLNLKG